MGNSVAKSSADVGAERRADISHLGDLPARMTYDAAAVVAVMPNGRLQIIRASAPDADAIRLYNRELYATDADTWTAMRTGQPRIQSGGILATLIDSPAAGRSLLVPAGTPLLAGYPAVLHVYRQSTGQAFTDDDIAALREALTESETQSDKVFVLTADADPIVGSDGWTALDPALRAAIAAHVRLRIADLSGDEDTLVDRRTHGGQGTSLRTVRYVFSRRSAAHPDRAGVIVCLQPDVEEWAALRGDHVPSHGELARFLPALRYMRQRAGESLTLNDVAQSVGLSPFHFHRRFVDLTGMTPKQYLLDAQIADAQRLLLEGQLELSTIARKCGFSHQSHFTSRFKQATGFTPTRWRKATVAEHA